MSAEQVATNWLPGLMVLGAGAANQHLVPAVEFEREKTRLELAAAEILRARDGRRHEDTKKQARAQKRAATQPAKHPALRGALVGGAVVAFFGLVGWQLTQTATSAPDDPQPSAVGPLAAPPADPKLEALTAGVQARPDDVEAVAALSLHLLLIQAFGDARPLVQRAARLDPFHPKARVGQAVVRGLDGDLRGSLEELERLAGRSPEATDGLLFAGLLAMENDQARALRNLEAYLQRASPSEQSPLVHLAVAQLRQLPAAAAP